MTQPKKRAAATAEVAAAQLTVAFKDATFNIPSQLPFRVLERLRDEDFVGIVELMLGDQMPAFWQLDPSLLEVTEEFLPALLGAYGLESGESSASTGS